MPIVRPSRSPSSGPDFDEFYLGSRRRLVLETYALTGDLSAARSAVRDAFVAARHHWDRVVRVPDPEEWVRPRAWAMAQRRHVARLWRREKGLTPAQKGVLDALHHLPDQQRKVLLLSTLAGMPTDDIGRELGEVPARVDDQLASAVRSFERRTDTTDGDVLGAIESLAPIAEATALPQPLTIHRGGQRRRRRHAVAGVVGLLALTVLGGLFVARGGVVAPAAAGQRADQHPVTAAMMLSVPELQPVAPGAGCGAGRVRPRRPMAPAPPERAAASPRDRPSRT